MQKTELSRTTNYTSHVDKPVEQKVTVITQRKPQYLDVALKQAEDEKKSEHKINTNVVKDVKNNVTGTKVKNKFSDQKGVKNTDSKGTIADKNKKESVRGNDGGKAGVSEKTKKITGLGSPTFQEKSKFKSVKNQKLFQELDQMLSGQDTGKGYSNKIEPMTLRPQKTEKITVLTRDSFYQPSSQGKPIRSKYSTIPPLKQNGIIDPESQILHKRELRAKQRIESLDSFTSGDFKSKLSQSRSVGNISSRINANISKGVPVNQGNIGTRHHYIADIPIYLPTFDSGNTSTSQAVSGPTQVIDKALGSNTTERRTDKKIPLAPEGFAGPQSQLFDVPDETLSEPNTLNSYRKQANPVRQRLIEEQLKKVVRGDKYSDYESKNQAEAQTMTQRTITDRSHIALYNSSQEFHDETIRSDPGTSRRMKPMEDLSRYKYSPEGFLAEQERKARQNRESRIQRQLDTASRIVQHEPKGSVQTLRSATGKRNERWQISKDNSWVQIDRQSSSNMRSYGQLSRREENNYFSDSTYRSTDRDTVRLSRSNSPRHIADHERDIHRTYQIPREIRDRERYNERASQEDRYTRNHKTKEYYESLRRNADKANVETDTEHRDGKNGYRDNRNRREDEVNGRYEDRYKTNKKDYDDGDAKKYERDSREFEHYLEEQFRDERRSRFDQVSKDISREYSFEKNSNIRKYHDNTGINTNYDRGGGRQTESVEPSSRKRKYSAEKKEVRSKSGELKVEYVLRNKSNSNDMLKNGTWREDKREPSTLQTYRTEKSDRSDRKSYVDDRPSETWRSLSPKQDRGSPTEQKKDSESGQKLEGDNFKKPPTYETRVIKQNSKHGDDFDRYFDAPEKVNSPSNRIPFYSENSSRYAKDKYEFNIPEVMTPVQEMSFRQPGDEGEDNSKNIPDHLSVLRDSAVKHNSTYPDDIVNRKPLQERDGYISSREPGAKEDIKEASTKEPEGIAKPSFLSSTINKHEIKEDRRSPWRKDEDESRDKDSPRQEYYPYPKGPDFGETKNDKRSESFEKIKEEVRQKTEEKLQKKREKTMESQGPTVDDLKFDYPEFTGVKEMKDKPETNGDHMQANKNYSKDLGVKIEPGKSDKNNKQDDNVDETSDKEKVKTELKADFREMEKEDFNLEDIETEMDENELYVCYLLTDDGESIGPLKLDIDDVQIGLPRISKEGEELDRQAKGEENKTDIEGNFKVSNITFM